MGGSKSGFTHGPVPGAEVPSTNRQPGFDTTDVTDPDLMSTDEVQSGDCTIIDHRKEPAVGVPEVDNPILGLFVPGSLSESVNSSSSIAIAPVVAINTVESLNGGKVSVPETFITPDTLGTADGINSSATNSAAHCVDGNSILPGDAMDLGDFVEKNAASTLVRDINTSTDSSVATPAVVKLSKSQKKRQQNV